MLIKLLKTLLIKLVIFCMNLIISIIIRINENTEVFQSIWLSNIFIKTNIGVLTRCVNSYSFQELTTINGYIEKYQFRNKKI